MAYVLSLISDPARAALEPSLVERARAAVKGGPGRVLADGVACDIALDAGGGEDAAGLLECARNAVGGAPVDVNILAGDDRRKRLLIADMDSTIIGQECLDELAEFANLRQRVSAITERAMRGELDFDAALRERVAMLKGVPETALEETFRNRITLTPGARTLVQTMNAAGATTLLVSGGFTFFTARVAAAAGFKRHQANTLLIENGALAGKVEEPVLGRAAKQDALLRAAAEAGLSLEETLAVGDGANDLSMLARAGLGVAFHAKAAVAETARARIDHGDLTALLYLQGIPQTEFSEP
ncbi:MAG: phosphoserine phosphatase SerB [Parvularculaceae bacterium]